MNQCTEARIVWTIIQIGVSFGPVSQPIPGLMKAVRALECHQESESSAWEGGTASSCHARPADAEQPWYERAVTEAERVQEIVIRSEDRPVELIVRHFAVGGEPAKTVRVRMMGGGLPTDKLAHVSRARSPGMQGPLRVSAENRARRTGTPGAAGERGQIGMQGNAGPSGGEPGPPGPAGQNWVAAPKACAERSAGWSARRTWSARRGGRAWPDRNAGPSG
jgi:hypothetical protein